MVTNTFFILYDLHDSMLFLSGKHLLVQPYYKLDEKSICRSKKRIAATEIPQAGTYEKTELSYKGMCSA